MTLLPAAPRAASRANIDAHHAARRARSREPAPAPLVRSFNPLGPATELDADGDTLFGLADLVFGCPTRGSSRFARLAAIRLPYGLGIGRDLAFASDTPLSRWMTSARAQGSIQHAEAALARARRAQTDPLPPPAPGSD